LRNLKYPLSSPELGKAGPPPAAKGKGKKGKAAGVGQHPDFKVEYAKSGRAACRGCSENITKVKLFTVQLDECFNFKLLTGSHPYF